MLIVYSCGVSAHISTLYLNCWFQTTLMYCQYSATSEDFVCTYKTVRCKISEDGSCHSSVSYKCSQITTGDRQTDRQISLDWELCDFVLVCRQNATVLNPVVTICTAQWSLYVPHSGHYMYRTVVTICSAQWSLYVPHIGHYMFRTVVTICTAQWSVYVPPV